MVEKTMLSFAVEISVFRNSTILWTQKVVFNNICLYARCCYEKPNLFSGTVYLNMTLNA